MRSDSKTFQWTSLREKRQVSVESVRGIFSFFFFYLRDSSELCCVDGDIMPTLYLPIVHSSLFTHMLLIPLPCVSDDCFLSFLCRKFVHFKPSIRAASARLWCFFPVVPSPFTSVHFFWAREIWHELKWGRVRLKSDAFLVIPQGKATFCVHVFATTSHNRSSPIIPIRIIIRQAPNLWTNERGALTLVNTNGPCSQRLPYWLIESLLRFGNAS